MDLWVVAAAAGAGYIAKNLQNLSADKKETLGGPSVKYSYNVLTESRNFLQQLRDKTCPLRRLAQKRLQDNAFPDVGNHSDDNLSEIDGLGSGDREDGVASISAEESLKFEDENLSRVNRGKLVRSRRCGGHSMRPLNYLGSCHDENMEHGTCLLCPSVSTVRPLLVSDGVWGNYSSFTEFDGGGEEARGEDTTFSASSKQFESVEEVKKSERSSGNLQQSGYVDARSSRPQGPETVLFLIAGMTIGILSATTSWKNEVDKLNNQLNQMDNLVQDLHEELDMKVMVKELYNEGDLPSKGKGTPLSIKEPISSPSDVENLDGFDNSKKNERNAENLELLSRIEAELQAELEMLEKNIKASVLERVSSVVEIDPDFEPEIVDGDLRATMVNDASSDSRNETTDTTTNHSKPANYTVSPWELSLRLHELIETRLQTRINELEITLGYGQNMVSERRLSYSDTESSSTQQSPTCIFDEHARRQEYPPAENFSSTYVDACKERNGISHGMTDEVREKERWTSIMYNEDSMNDDEDSDESDMLLIKKIVERRKSGSSFNLKIH